MLLVELCLFHEGDECGIPAEMTAIHRCLARLACRQGRSLQPESIEEDFLTFSHAIISIHFPTTGIRPA
jgi:hypothetical protein